MQLSCQTPLCVCFAPVLRLKASFASQIIFWFTLTGFPSYLMRLEYAYITPLEVIPMKTRAEIYGNEAATLLRIVTMYPGLNMQQLLCFHPGKEEIIKTLLSHLQKQGRIFQTDTGGYFPSGWAAKSDNSLIRAAWVLLDLSDRWNTMLPVIFRSSLSSLQTVNYTKSSTQLPARRP